MAEKRETRVSVDESSLHPDDSDVVKYNGTNADAWDMFRLGKKQQFKRQFGFVSIVGFMTIMTASWESTLLVPSFGLLNGGTAGLIGNTFAVSILSIVLSVSRYTIPTPAYRADHAGLMAELASMAPTSGGQYHWVSELAPPSFQQPLSFVVGWCCCLGWVSSIPAACQMIAALVKGMVLLTYPDADVNSLWRLTLLIFLVLFLASAFNAFLSKHLAMLENCVFYLHCAGFITFLGVLWGTSDIAPAKRVFTQTNDGGGWGNIGLATLVGLTTSLWCFLAADAGAHMAEELRDASLTLPKAVVWTTVLNAAMGITMMITFCFCVGDVTSVLNTSTVIQSSRLFTTARSLLLLRVSLGLYL